MTPTDNFVALLDDLAVLRINGPDAVDFLQSQLSNDIAGMGISDARLAAYCNAKGRMQASLVLWHETPEATGSILATVKADLAEALVKRLRMFVLRAKVNIEITALSVYGVSRAGAHAEASGTDLATAPMAAWQVDHDSGMGTLLSAPSWEHGPLRQWLVSENGSAESIATHWGAAVGLAAAWNAQDIQAGLGWIESANYELFIPQSLNFDVNSGVSFTKGCYPGQEVVARAHFRGAVKRRGFPAYCRLKDGQLLKAGEDVFDAKRPGAPAGRIINAAMGGPNRGEAGQSAQWHVFMELNSTDIGEADLRVVSPEGPNLVLLPLPYSLEVKS